MPIFLQIRNSPMEQTSMWSASSAMVSRIKELAFME